MLDFQNTSVSLSNQSRYKDNEKRGPQMSERPRRRISLVRWVVSTIILIPVLLIWSFFLTGHWRTFKVISRSMEPTLLVDDYLIMREQNDFPILDNKIVVIRDPQGGTFPLVKRVIAGANSIVRISNGRIYIDNSKTALPGEPLTNTPSTEWKLGPDELFLLGDNRNNSQDSSDFGPLTRSEVMGVITYRYWPFARAGSLH